MSPTGYSIGTRIFGAFVAMGAIIAVLGAAGYFVISAAGDMTVTTFDGPLMADQPCPRRALVFTEAADGRAALVRPRHPAEKAAIAADIAEQGGSLQRRSGCRRPAFLCRGRTAPDRSDQDPGRAMARGPRQGRHQGIGQTRHPDRRPVRQPDRIQHRSLLCRPQPGRHQYRQLSLRHCRRDAAGIGARRRHHPVPAPAHHSSAFRRGRSRRPHRQG